MESWFTPWRYEYLVSPRERGGCLFCAIRESEADRENLVLHRGASSFVVINRYPYNNGHLMIVPHEHCGFLAELPIETQAEMVHLAASCEQALREVYKPEGLNLGLNLGKSAGAGITGHLHLHILPRWEGDTNFMSIVGGARIIPEELSTTYERLAPLLRDASPPQGHRP